MNQTAQLRITAIRLIGLKVVKQLGELEPAWDPGGHFPFQIGGGAFVEIQTDQGLTGIGPAVDASLMPVIKAKLTGQDPFAVEQHAATLRYYASGVPYRGSAGIDIALWDLIGKACGQPLYKLWGVSKDKVPAYASMMLLSNPQERAEIALRHQEAGWQAVKLRLHHETIQQDIATVAAVRDAVGDAIQIMVDANQAQSSANWQPGVRWDYRRAVETARELQQLNCYWLEEPLPRFYFEQLAALNRAVEIPIAGGENNTHIHEFVQMLQNNVYDILQPECMVTQGITDLRKIAVLGEAYGKKVVPHHGGRGLATVAHLHLVASWAHAPYLELLHEPPVGDYSVGFSIFQDPPVLDGEGFIGVPQAPGLGVEINPDLIAETLA
jgi:L-alanine-DL-glutamate epimerase-like enolase superfamily enzyme